MKNIVIIFILCFVLSSCTINKNDIDETEDNPVTAVDNTAERQEKTFSNLLRTNEFATSEQMEEIKAQALSWQSAQAGIGGFADIVAIEPSDGSNQQVFISVDYKTTYEKIQIQPPEGAEARIISAFSGAGSGEIEIGYKFTADNSEWVELFYAYTGNLINDNEAQWENITKFSGEIVQALNKLSIDERQFK